MMSRVNMLICKDNKSSALNPQDLHVRYKADQIILCLVENWFYEWAKGANEVATNSRE